MFDTLAAGILQILGLQFKLLTLILFRIMFKRMVKRNIAHCCYTVVREALIYEVYSCRASICGGRWRHLVLIYQNLGGLAWPKNGAVDGGCGGGASGGCRPGADGRV